MSQCADFDRSTKGMEELFEEVSQLCDSFFAQAVIKDDSEISELFKLYDMVLTQCATLSAMLLSAKEIGTHGSAFVDRLESRCNGERRTTRTLTRGRISEIAPISEMPDPELWFETLLARKRAEQ